MKINIVGNILGTDGYTSHTKGLANALYKLNPDIKLDVTLQPGWEQKVTDAELKMIKTPNRIPDVTIGIVTPPFARIVLGDITKHYIQYVVWEGNKIPTSWIEYLMDERIDQIWVPSLHTRQAIMTTAVVYCNLGDDEKIQNKIKIVPHGYDSKIYSQRKEDKDDGSNVSLSGATKQLQGKNNKDEQMSASVDNHVDKLPFKIIVNKGWRGGMEDRGGVQFVLQAYSNEFKKDENIELLLKLNPSYINPAQVSQKIDELKLPKDSANIKIACANMSPKQICDLYNESDVCVCATRAEAFDLGTCEAMACGLPIITTGYGGQIEHMDESCADFIDYKLQEVKGDIQYEGISQAIPDINHLRKLMRLSFNNKEKTRIKGINAKNFIKEFTWDKSAEKAITFLNKLS